MIACFAAARTNNMSLHTLSGRVVAPKSGLFACHHAAKAGAAKTTTSQVERFHETGNGKAFWMRLSQYAPVERYRTDVTVHNCAIDSDTIPTSSLPFSYCLHLDLGQ